MASKVTIVYLIADGLFVVMGAIMLGFSVIVQNTMNNTPTDGTQAVRNLFYQMFPLTVGIVNAVFVFATFLMTIPGIITPARSWIKIGAYMTVVCAIFSLIIGLDLWVLTLRTKENFQPVWNNQPASTQDLMQTAFNCCGFLNSTSPAFVTDAQCPSPAAAALQPGCAASIGLFGNVFIDDIFTAVFGMVGVDVVFVMAATCLIKERRERERFRHIDEKTGASTF